MEIYKSLEKKFDRLDAIGHALDILHWDEAVMMPQGAGDSRGEAVADLAALYTEMIQSKEMSDSLNEALQSAETPHQLDEWQLANLHRMKDVYTKASVLPPDFVQKQTRIAMKSEQVWRKCRGENDWQGFMPYLQETVDLAREESQRRAEATGLSAYDALLDKFEKGLCESKIESWFSSLRSELPGLIEQATATSKAAGAPLLPDHVSVEIQNKICRAVMTSLGFDFSQGRLDVSHHPFCGGVPTDVRVTTRYLEHDMLESIMATIHETGHASYDQNLPRNYIKQPVGSPLGMMVHEGQSLFFENMIGRSQGFAELLTRVLHEHLPEYKTMWTAENVGRALRKVEPGFIRTSADEVTYPAHVMLRFDIERQLINGQVEVKDLPELWNEQMTQLLGLSTTGNDKDGVMQDAHWPGGAFGYFPTYTLGAMFAAQMFDRTKKSIARLEEKVAQGDFAEVKTWLKTNIWSQGSKVSGEELLKQATGNELQVELFLSHLRERYC
jgi:carboxypeptidase Taq